MAKLRDRDFIRFCDLRAKSFGVLVIKWITRSLSILIFTLESLIQLQAWDQLVESFLGRHDPCRPIAKMLR